MSERPTMTQPQAQSGGMLQVTTSREIEEVRGAIFMAREFPRRLDLVMERLRQTCSRYALAEQAAYAFPRGSEMISGPSIRLAEAIAQNYGNLRFGVRELRQENVESTVQSFCWDMETNVSQEKIFTVPHIRQTKQGRKTLTDPRDIYELVANQGARRLRSCILGVIPADVVEACETWCEETLKKGAGKPIAERIRLMVAHFEKLGVGRELLEKRLKHRIESTSEAELVQYAKICRSIADNMAKPADFFDIKAADVGAAADLNAAFAPGDAREPGQ